ncbi:MAG: hypothetical protein LKJ28_04760 [Bifidobacteriaceae bacterium]|jgi:hypothetical protein|nr:hypothetical protein [Bifidobacteriaceae bacterium]
MSYEVDFKEVSQEGLESSPVAAALAGLRANEARYFSTHYKADFVVSAVEEDEESSKTLEFVEHVLKTERNLEFASKPLETAMMHVDDYRWAFVFFESGLEVNVMYSEGNPKKRAVGFKLSEGMDIPEELAAAGFKFARQKSKLAGVIRGSFFVIKGEY